MTKFLNLCRLLKNGGSADCGDGDVSDSRVNFSGDEPWPKTVTNKQLYADFEIFASRLKRYIPEQTGFSRQLNKLIEPLEYVRLDLGDGRERARLLPSLEECRKVFEDLLKMKVDWDDGRHEIAPF